MRAIHIPDRNPYNALLDLQLPISSNIDDEATHEVCLVLLNSLEHHRLTYATALSLGLRGGRPRRGELRDVVRTRLSFSIYTLISKVALTTWSTTHTRVPTLILKTTC